MRYCDILNLISVVLFPSQHVRRSTRIIFKFVNQMPWMWIIKWIRKHFPLSNWILTWWNHKCMMFISNFSCSTVAAHQVDSFLFCFLCLKCHSGAVCFGWRQTDYTSIKCLLKEIVWYWGNIMCNTLLVYVITINKASGNGQYHAARSKNCASPKLLNHFWITHTHTFSFLNMTMLHMCTCFICRYNVIANIAGLCIYLGCFFKNSSVIGENSLWSCVTSSIALVCVLCIFTI